MIQFPNGHQCTDRGQIVGRSGAGDNPVNRDSEIASVDALRRDGIGKPVQGRVGGVLMCTAAGISLHRFNCIP